MKNDTDSTTKDTSITYALGCIETRLSQIARDLNESEQELREWVGILLLSSGQGNFNQLSNMRRETPKMGKPVEQMAVELNTHRKTYRKKDTSSKVNSSKKGFSYNGKHWMQLPENKERVRKMMKARHAARRAKKAA